MADLSPAFVEQPLPTPVTPQELETSFRWATITAVEPGLRIRLDGALDEIPFQPDMLTENKHEIGDRVWVQLYGKRIIVLGAAYGGSSGMNRMQFTTTASTWYRVASVMYRGMSRFRFFDLTSGQQGVLQILASHAYGKNVMTVELANSFGSSGGIIAQVRFVYLGTNDGAFLEVYADSAGTVFMEMEPVAGWVPGWQMVTPAEVGSIPAGWTSRSTGTSNYGWGAFSSGATGGASFYVLNDGTAFANYGLAIASSLATDVSDVSKHISLDGTGASTVGINRTTSTVNFLNTGGIWQFIGASSGIRSAISRNGQSWDSTTAITGTANKIAMRWGSPNINGGVDDSNTMVLGTVSDRSLKTAVEPLQSGLVQINQLRPISFSPLELDQSLVPTIKRYPGLIADEVDTVLTDVVERTANDPNGLASVNYNALAVVLVKALQDLSTKHDTLQAQMDALQTQVNALQTQVTVLKTRLDNCKACTPGGPHVLPAEVDQ